MNYLIVLLTNTSLEVENCDPHIPLAPPESRGYLQISTFNLCTYPLELCVPVI